MLLKRFSLALVLAMCVSQVAIADEPSITITGETTVTIPTYQNQSFKGALAPLPTGYKKISLLKINLSDNARNYLKTHLTSRVNPVSLKATAASLPPQQMLGMNNVPVLDQGQHGTCVTFAVTAAIDALNNQGDYISQLCNLELGITLNGILNSGWNGNVSEVVLNQIKNYSIIKKYADEDNGIQSQCGGLDHYPANDGSTIGDGITLKQFKAHEQYDANIKNTFSWKMSLSPKDAFSSKSNPEEVLAKVKQGLANGQRSTFGFLLDTHQETNERMSTVGIFGSYKTQSDSWILTPAIRQDFKTLANHKHSANEKIDEYFGGHEMIIIGYDDNALLKGIKQSDDVKGALIIRNSWGNDAGDEGNFYMSYDYFKFLVMEAATIN